MESLELKRSSLSQPKSPDHQDSFGESVGKIVGSVQERVKGLFSWAFGRKPEKASEKTASVSPVTSAAKRIKEIVIPKKEEKSDLKQQKKRDPLIDAFVATAPSARPPLHLLNNSNPSVALAEAIRIGPRDPLKPFPYAASPVVDGSFVHTDPGAGDAYFAADEEWLGSTDTLQTPFADDVVQACMEPVQRQTAAERAAIAIAIFSQGGEAIDELTTVETFKADEFEVLVEEEAEGNEFVSDEEEEGLVVEAEEGIEDVEYVPQEHSFEAFSTDFGFLTGGKR